MNGNGERITTPNLAKPAVPKNFKLLHDPMLTGKKEPKLFRYEGIVQGELTSSVVVLDPRSRITALSKRLEPLDIPVPRCDAAPTRESVLFTLIFSPLAGLQSTRSTLESRQPSKSQSGT